MLFSKKNSEKSASRVNVLNASLKAGFPGKALNDGDLAQVVGGIQKNNWRAGNLSFSSGRGCM